MWYFSTTGLTSLVVPCLKASVEITSAGIHLLAVAASHFHYWIFMYSFKLYRLCT